MNPVTLRRLLVFGVCAVGVGALYVVPALGGHSGQVAAPPPNDEPTSWPTATATTAIGPVSHSTSRPEPTPDAASTTPDGSSTAPVSLPPTRRPSPSGATAYDPRGGSDNVAPAPVTAISTGPVTRDRLTVSWPPATDDVGVQRYRVVLNGFTVATTRKTHATVRWFNDDLGDHVIQVLALDAAGNESPSSPNLLVSRPTPEPTPEPTPSTTPSPPSPTPSPSASSPEPSPSLAPNEADQPEGASPTPVASASGRN
ncbi:hypothetical protein [uncultured Friedmanniella sp.]|uniref:hypothetical protein n=1 Tax=uncultured Friedmanniella sp. TaxID=335381 RepID=UPI0035CBAEBB